MAGSSSSGSRGPAGAQGSTLRADAPAFVPSLPAGAPAAAGSGPGRTALPSDGVAARQPPQPPCLSTSGGGGGGGKKQAGAAPQHNQRSQAPKQQGQTKPQQPQEQTMQQQQKKGSKQGSQAQPPSAAKQRQQQSKGQAQRGAAAAKLEAPPKPSQGGHGKGGTQPKGKGKGGRAHTPAAAAGASGGSSAPSPPSWAALPPDLLRRIFAAALPRGGAPTPLLQVAQQWFALRLVCHSWAAVLEEDCPAAAAPPVSVLACLPVPAAVPWLHRHATSLRLAPPPLQAAAGPPGDPAEAMAWLNARCGRLHLPCATKGERNHPMRSVAFEYETFLLKLALGQQEERGEPRSRLIYGCKLFLPLGTTKRAAKEDCPGLLRQAVLDLGALTRLQELDVTWGPAFDWRQPHTFDCSPLARLPALRSLTLRGFAEPCLAGLPAGLRQLTIDGGWSRGGRYRPMAFFTLPEHSSLVRVRVLGYQRDFMSCALELYATQLFLAAPEEYDELNAVELFHDRRRFKVNLASLCGHSQEVITDAELLHLGLSDLEAARLAAVPPPPYGSGSEESGSEGWDDEEEDEEGPWPPGQPSPWAPDYGLKVQLSLRDEDVVAAVDALAEAMGNSSSGSPQQRRLQIRGSALFVLPSGALVPARLLEQPAGRRALQERWPGVQLMPVAERALTLGQLLAIVGRESWSRWLVLTWPPPS